MMLLSLKELFRGGRIGYYIYCASHSRGKPLGPLIVHIQNITKLYDYVWPTTHQTRRISNIGYYFELSTMIDKYSTMYCKLSEQYFPIKYFWIEEKCLGEFHLSFPLMESMITEIISDNLVQQPYVYNSQLIKSICEKYTYWKLRLYPEKPRSCAIL